MARTKYGITWWGQQWLNALSNIDFSNRLPRGRTYANKGLVRSTSVNKNHISAKVQGTRPRPYRIDITVPLFFKDEKIRLVDEVANNPSLVAQLLNRELPPDLLQFAEKQGIKVFPNTWRDFGMECSCPDWAVPCKHLAAVIYSVAEEIDRNPFLVFELHGLDLVKELENRNIRIADQKEERITSVESLLVSSAEPVPNSLRVGSQQKLEKETLPIHQQIDFTTIPAVGDQILTLFKPQPLFYEKDFKAIIQKLYKGAARAGAKVLKGNVMPDKRQLDFVATDTLHLVFDENLLLENISVTSRKGKDKPQKFNGLRLLLSSMFSYDTAQLHRSHPSIKALLEVFHFSMFLAKNGAVMPQLLECENKEFRIRWLPAIIVDEVADLFEKMADRLPLELLSVEKKKKTFGQTKEETLNTLCSLFIGHCISEAAWHEEHPLPKMFFWTTDGQPLRFDKPQQEVEITMTKSRSSDRGYSRYGWYPKSPTIKTKVTGHKLPPDTPQLLQLWLNNFYITHKDHVPLIKVEDLDGPFGIEIEVEYWPDLMRPPVPLSHIFTKKKYEGVKYDVLKDVMLLAEFFPQLNRIINSQGKERLVFNEVEFVEVLLKMLPALSLFGIRILLPKGLKHLVRPKATLLAKKSPGQDEGSFLTFDDLMAFDW